ncbi:MAG TPA: CopD family protein [Candidatus Binatia bacterium]|nr:CopD family protein [Candidatus Binatia bacterium]
MLTALAALLGALAVDRLAASADSLPAARRRLRRLATGAAVVLLLGSAAELLVRTQTMVGPGGSLVAGVPVVVARTHFGRIWLARVALIVATGVLALGHGRRPRALALGLAAGVALTTALTGHLADWGDVTPSVGLDWAHVAAASVWTGGLAALALACARGAWPAESLPRIAARFSRLAGLCLLVVLVTGAWNVWVQLPDVAALWTTSYGRVLAGKLALATALVVVGGFNRYSIVARLDARRGRGRGARLFRRARLVLVGPSSSERRRLPSRFAACLTAEAVLAAAVFAATAVLGESVPARHARHAGHAHVAEPTEGVRITMEALHAAGGVPHGWLFTPPAGDARHGREVFRRLQCYACHVVAGEDFPPPTAAGPELTAMGAHHPAGYLAESVMSPNAVIVEGPGYVGPDGRSTMPDYRDSLTVGELVDLVAYLRSLHD